MNYINKQQGIAHLLLIIIILAILGGAGYYLIQQFNIQVPGLSKPTPPPVQELTEAKISITNQGFVPQTLKVKAGTQVTWVNEDKSSHQIASDPHPTHTLLPELDSNAMLSTSSFSFTFENPGTYTYHDHLNPTQFTGTIIVE